MSCERETFDIDENCMVVRTVERFLVPVHVLGFLPLPPLPPVPEGFSRECVQITDDGGRKKVRVTDREAPVAIGGSQ